MEHIFFDFYDYYERSEAYKIKFEKSFTYDVSNEYFECLKKVKSHVK